MMTEDRQPPDRPTAAACRAGAAMFRAFFERCTQYAAPPRRHRRRDPDRSRSHGHHEGRDAAAGRAPGPDPVAYADLEADNDRFTIRHDRTEAGAFSTVGGYPLVLFGPRATSNLRAGRNLALDDVDAELAPTMAPTCSAAPEQLAAILAGRNSGMIR